MQRFLPVGQHLAAFTSPGFALGLFAVLVAACCVADISQPRAVAVLMALAVVAVLLARLPGRVMVSRLVPLGVFLGLGAVLLLLVPVGPGTETVPLPVWGHPVAAQGYHFIISLAVKSGVIVILATAFAHRMSQRDLLEGLIAVRAPARITALCYLMVRSLHGVGQETRRLMRGRDARGRAAGLRGVKVAGAMAGVLLVRLGRRAETQALALAARGFDGAFSLARHRPVTAGHLVTLAACAGVLAWLLR